MLFKFASRTRYIRQVSQTCFFPHVITRRLSQSSNLCLPIQPNPSDIDVNNKQLIQRMDANDTRFTELEKRVEQLETLLHIFQHNLEGVINEQHIMNRKLCPSVWELYRVHNNGK